MKNSNEQIEKRRERILEILGFKKDYEMSVIELANILNVSPLTIRRDLSILEHMGKINKKHGVVKLIETPNFEGTTNNHYIEKVKEAIAKKAAHYITPQSTVFINTSSTALMALDYLMDKPLTIVSNNAKIIDKHFHANSSIHLTGGEIRFPKEALVGENAISSIQSIHADVAIIGCSGISAENGISTINMNEKNVNIAFIEQTNKRIIVVADYRKIGYDANFIIGKLNKVDLLITDIYTDINEVKKIEKAGIQVILVEP